MNEILPCLLLTFNLPSNVYFTLRKCTFFQISYDTMIQELKLTLKNLNWRTIYEKGDKFFCWGLQHTQIWCERNFDGLTVTYLIKNGESVLYIEDIDSYEKFFRAINYFKKASLSFEYFYNPSTLKDQFSEINSLLSQNLKFIQIEQESQLKYYSGDLSFLITKHPNGAFELDVYVDIDVIHIYEFVNSDQHTADIFPLVRDIIRREK